MDGQTSWRNSVERIEAIFERAETEVLCATLRELRRSGLPPIAETGQRLLSIQGLERAERCAAAGYLALARAEFERAVARVEEGCARPRGAAGLIPSAESGP